MDYREPRRQLTTASFYNGIVQIICDGDGDCHSDCGGVAHTHACRCRSTQMPVLYDLSCGCMILFSAYCVIVPLTNVFLRPIRLKSCLYDTSDASGDAPISPFVVCHSFSTRQVVVEFSLNNHVREPCFAARCTHPCRYLLFGAPDDDDGGGGGGGDDGDGDGNVHYNVPM